MRGFPQFFELNKRFAGVSLSQPRRVGMLVHSKQGDKTNHDNHLMYIKLCSIFH